MNSPPGTSETEPNQEMRLSLVPFEQFMLLEDQPEYPMVFVFRLTFQGKMNREALSISIEQAAKRHPLLHSLLVTEDKGQLVWQTVEQYPNLTWLEDASLLSDLIWQEVDLKSEIGLRVFAMQEGEQTRLYFRFHHACSDGLGSYAYFEDLLSLYDAYDNTPPQSPQLKTLDSNLLLGRGEFGTPPTPATPTPTTHPWRDFFGGAKESAKFLLQPPRPLAPDLQDKGPDSTVPEAGFITYQLPEEQLPALRRKAEEAGASLNDLLLRDLFLTLRQWNQDHQFGSAKSRLQIMMPTGLRGAKDKDMPAANMISYAFLLRTAQACDQPEELLTGLAAETKAIIRYQYSLLFIGSISLLLKLPFALRAMLRRKRCFGTAVLTNLGDPTRRFARRFPRKKGQIQVGGIVLEEITGVPPLRPLTGAVFSAFTYAGKLQISLRCDPHRFSPAATQSLLDLYVKHLQNSAS